MTSIILFCDENLDDGNKLIQHPEKMLAML